MKKDNQVYITDIQNAIKRIEDYTNGVDFEIFQNEEMRHDAVIRQLEIVGEATNRLSNEFSQDHPNFPFKEAVAMRNFLIHGYDDVDLKVVWKTVQEDIPILKRNIESLS